MTRRKPNVVDIRYTVRSPRLTPFEKMAAAALPNEYQLSLVICGDKLAQRMNKEYRKKSYKPNVLAFPLSRNEGEIFLNVRKAAREARAEGISTHARSALLFVHGCFHLAGYKHGDKMEALERKMLKRFGF